MNTNEIEMVSLEQLVSWEHIYRKFLDLLAFKRITERLKKLEKNKRVGGKGYGIEIIIS